MCVCRGCVALISLTDPQKNINNNREARPRVRLNGKQRAALMAWLEEYGGACAMVQT